MSIYTLNLSQLWTQLIPPILRQPVQNAWGKAVLTPSQYDNDLFNEYIDGSLYNFYGATASYSSLARVVGSDRGVYENIGATISGDNPVGSTSGVWSKVNDNYIGASERAVYSARRYLYEFALNRWFELPNITYSTVYSSSNQNIYIQTNVATSSSFVMGQTSAYSSDMGNLSSTAVMTNVYQFPTLYDYTVYVPTSVWNAYGASDVQFRGFCDLVNIAGIEYNVIPY